MPRWTQATLGMTKYTLKYFNVTGLGEPIRYVFAYGKIPFNDIRFEMADFEKYKPFAPFGKVPVVEFDGKKIHQSAAICRYFAKQTGLAGKTDWDQLQADMAVDTFNDFREHFKVWFNLTDVTAKSAQLELIKNTHAPYYLGRFDKQVQENGGYFVKCQHLESIGTYLEKMAPQYKLTYFTITGLGEPVRYMLAHGNIPFEDFRFEMADFGQYKPSTPFGKVPVLEIDGKKIHQSHAICRYLAKQSGIAGKSDWDQLQADIAVDTFTDFRLNLTAYFREQDETAKAAKLEEIKTELIPFYFERFDKQVGENGGYLVNSQLTWADIYISALLDMMLNMMKYPLLDPYKNLLALKTKVDHLPGIKEYRAKRPATAF